MCKIQTMRCLISVAVSSVMLILVAGCEKSPLNPTEDKEVKDGIVATAAASGPKVYQAVNSLKTAESMMQGSASHKRGKAPNVGSVQQGIALSKKVIVKMHQGLKGDAGKLAKAASPAGESILWDIRWRDNQEGISYHVVLIYDDQTGRARAYYVAYDFAERYKLAYDSTCFAFDLNFTIEDSTDDVFLALDNLKRYKSSNYIQSEETHYDPDDCPAGEEPTGGRVEVTTIYAVGQDLDRKKEFFEAHQENQGVFRREIWFTDDSYSSEEYYYYPDGTGRFEEIQRDGTRVNATFDDASIDGEGAYTKVTSFPAGHDPVSKEETGTFTIEFPDSLLTGTFTEQSLYSDGHRDSSSFDISQTYQNQVKTTKIRVQSSTGESGEIILNESDTQSEVDAEWLNQDGTFAQYHGILYPDERAIIDVSIYASKEAFLNGDEPIFTGHFEFNPDGSGSGELVSKDGSFKVKVSSDGSQTVTS